MKKIIIFILPLFIVMGCDKQLDLTSPNEMTTGDFWKTQDQAIAGNIAVYQTLIEEGCYMHWTQVLTDGRGDDIKAISPWLNYQWVSNFTIGNHSNDPFMQHVVWEEWYILIYRANQVLENVPGITMDDALKTRIIGQTYFLRGLAYFKLANLFKVVPVITATAKDQNDYYPATAPEDTLWNQIYSDLKKAKDMLPISYSNVTGPDKGQIGRATKGAATGILGKAYLYRKLWQKAADEFSLLIDGPDLNIYSLVPKYQDNFTISNENNAESIFEVQFATIDQVGGSVTNWRGEPGSTWKQINATAANYSNKGWTDFLPTQWLYNEFKLEKTKDGKTDPRLLATIASYEPADNDTTYYGTGWITSGKSTSTMYIRKYTNDGTPGYTTELAGDPISGINYRVLRYADILLMYAEALNELNKTNEAYSYIQQVRNRVNLPDLSVTKPGMNQIQMRDQISHERTLELAIEGQRADDLIRWGWFYDATRLAELKSHDADFNTWTTGHEYLPIPQDELDNNKNLSKNPAN